jgi:hypothetical protein
MRLQVIFREPSIKGIWRMGETGHPVFDFRAGFRRAARFVQRALLLLGLLLALFGGLTWLCPGACAGGPRVAAWEFLAGGALLAAGLGWGFTWRGWLRRDFQKRHGPET